MKITLKAGKNVTENLRKEIRGRPKNYGYPRCVLAKFLMEFRHKIGRKNVEAVERLHVRRQPIPMGSFFDGPPISLAGRGSFIAFIIVQPDNKWFCHEAETDSPWRRHWLHRSRSRLHGGRNRPGQHFRGKPGETHSPYFAYSGAITG